MENSEVTIRNEGEVVVAEGGGVQIVIDPDGKILTSVQEMTHAQYIKDAETEIAMDIIREKKPLPVVPVEVYFRHVKAHMQPLDEIRLRPYMERLSRVAKHMKSLNQISGYKVACERLIISAKEIDMKVNHGVEFWVERAAVEGFMHYTTERGYNAWKKGDPRIVRFKPFKDFPRLIPKHIEGIVKSYQEKGIFDDFEILYIDRSGQGDSVGESALSAKSKDPILFGVNKLDTSRLYYITAWDDEHCDMTFDEMVENGNFEDGDFSNIPEADEITEEYIEKLEAEIERSKSSRPHYSFGTEKILEKDPETGRAPSRVWERIKTKFQINKRIRDEEGRD